MGGKYFSPRLPDTISHIFVMPCPEFTLAIVSCGSVPSIYEDIGEYVFDPKASGDASKLVSGKTTYFENLALELKQEVTLCDLGCLLPGLVEEFLVAHSITHTHFFLYQLLRAKKVSYNLVL